MAGVLARCRLQVLLHRCSTSSCRSGNLSEGMRRSLVFRSGSHRMLSGGDTEGGKAAAVRQQLDAAAREDRLDFLTAAKILFSTPPKPRTFGLDFHLWQFFVACLPPFAVYLVAQYSRSEMRRMEKEREEAKQLKLLATLAEPRAAQTADEESELVELSSTSKLGIDPPAMQQEQKEDTKLKSKDESSVILPEKDFLAMKARLDDMEEKLRLLESVRAGTTFVIPLGSELTAPKRSEEENVQKTAAGKADSVEEVGEDHHRKLEKQRNDSPLQEQNRKDLSVSTDSERRSWLGTRHKENERELSER